MQTYLVIVQTCMVVIQQFLVLCHSRGERVQGVCVCVCVCVCGGGGGLSADLPCYCPESCGSSPAVPGTLPQCADAHVEV